MCDHCSKVTTQKGYGGQVTCRCENGGGGEKEEVRREMDKSRDFDGRCNRKGKEAGGSGGVGGGCIASKCGAVTKDGTGGECCTDGATAKTTRETNFKKSCCSHK